MCGSLAVEANATAVANINTKTLCREARRGVCAFHALYVNINKYINPHNNTHTHTRKKTCLALAIRCVNQ